MATDSNLEMSTGKLYIDESEANFRLHIKVKEEEENESKNYNQEVLYFNASDGSTSNCTYELLGDDRSENKSAMGMQMQLPYAETADKMVHNPALQLVKYKSVGDGKNIKFWECGICHKAFSHQYILMRHLPTHTDERKYVCAQCGKAFRQISTLAQHATIHSKIRPHVCDICQKTFNRVSTLISHQKTHTGNKPHCCHLCNKAFHQKGNLRNHIFTHTNERPYKCDVCHKGFNQMSNLMCHKLKAHQRSDKLKYNCATCGKMFQKRIALRNHEQYAHGEVSLVASAAGGVPTPSGGGGVAVTAMPPQPNPPTPSVKYTNGVIVPRIHTAAMKHAAVIGVVPFALLKPLDGVPVLVRVFPSGDNQLLVPATKEDLNKYTTLLPKLETAAGDEDKENRLPVDNNAPPVAPSNGSVTSVSVRIPIVAVVIQRMLSGAMRMDILEPGPDAEQRQLDVGAHDVDNHVAHVAVAECSEGNGGAGADVDGSVALDKRTYDAIDEYDEDNVAQYRDPNMYEAAASLIDLCTRPYYAIDVDHESVEIFNHDEIDIDIDITNSVIDLEKDHEAYGIIAENGYSVAAAKDKNDEHCDE